MAAVGTATRKNREEGKARSVQQTKAPKEGLYIIINYKTALEETLGYCT